MVNVLNNLKNSKVFFVCVIALNLSLLIYHLVFLKDHGPLSFFPELLFLPLLLITRARSKNQENPDFTKKSALVFLGIILVFIALLVISIYQA